MRHDSKTHLLVMEIMAMMHVPITRVLHIFLNKKKSIVKISLKLPSSVNVRLLKNYIQTPGLILKAVHLYGIECKAEVHILSLENELESLEEDVEMYVIITPTGPFPQIYPINVSL
jgi:hypothetical protein